MNRAKRYQGKGRGRAWPGDQWTRGKGADKGQLSMIAAMKSKSKAKNERRLTAAAWVFRAHRKM